MSLDADVAAAVEQLRKARHIGLSAAVNELARAGLAAAPRRRQPFTQRTFALGAKIDVSNIAEALEILEGPEHR